MTKMQVDTKLIRELADLLSETDLNEIEVADGERRIRVARAAAHLHAASAPAPTVAPSPPPAEASVAKAPDMASHPGLVASPMVGTVYVAAEPGAPPLVQVGDQVKEGQTLLIVEAMKVMNPIAAPRGGTVKEIFVQNEQPVEYGEPLMLIE
ncbi:MAG: acetyl-CoA carboxylase biotin carboxyl carrier protein [Pseudomonadota bacterium]